MAYTVQNALDDVSGMMHGGTTDDIQNLSSLFNRTARILLSKLDPVETKRITNITNPIHDDVYLYTAPSDLKDKKVIDIRPQVNRTVADNFSQVYTEAFGKRESISDNLFVVDFKDGTRYLRISKNVSPAPTVINNVNGITDNGTWAVSGDASNLTEDSLNYVSGGKSLNFDLDASGSTAIISNSTMTQVDLTDHDEQSTLFAWVYLPDASIITNVILRWGNDSSNYWSATATAQQDGTAFRNGWNLVSFAWNGATETGTVTPSAIDYLHVTITYDGTAETDIRVDNIISSLGQIFEIEYYSKFLFQNTSGVFVETIDATTDTAFTINLDSTSYTIFTYELAKGAAQQLQGEDMVADVSFLNNELTSMYRKYKADNPSDWSRPISTYYTIK